MTHFLIIQQNSSTLLPSYTPLPSISAAATTVHSVPTAQQRQPTHHSRTNSQRFLHPTRITVAMTISRRTSTWSRSTSRRPPLSTTMATALPAVRPLLLRTAAEAPAQGAQARSQISSVRRRPDGHGLRVAACLLVVVVMARGALGVIRGAWRGAVVLGRVKARTTR